MPRGMKSQPYVAPSYTPPPLLKRERERERESVRACVRARACVCERDVLGEELTDREGGLFLTHCPARIAPHPELTTMVGPRQT